MLRQQDPGNPASTTNGAISQIISVSPATPCYASLKGKRKIVFDGYGAVSRQSCALNDAPATGSGRLTHAASSSFACFACSTSLQWPSRC